jgi:hypothetical protein
MCSLIGNSMPLGNATSGVHDNWMDHLPGAANYPTMLPAAALTITGALDGFALGGQHYSLANPLLTNIRVRQ